MDYRDVPGGLCPSGVAGLGVFAVRWGLATANPHFANAANFTTASDSGPDVRFSSGAADRADVLGPARRALRA
ncbi:MAG TPA: hypothetical protein VNJ02_20620 [Vicinamibacterales bacterium]|nr:hypothetical protein [Vicinamibacterales bacterium]